ncbi:MAG: hypothetical protein ABL958_02585 [Bdellovibrionia bacterium]
MIVVALLTFFPEIASTIADISNGLAERIGEKEAIDKLFAKIKEQGSPESQAKGMAFLLTADIGISIINYVSYAAVFLIKYLMLALYHFFWSILCCIAPLAILCSLFEGLSQVTRNLFSSMIEISLWNIVWQIMAVMLLGLSVLHPTGKNYFDAICFNFLLVIAMVATPLIVHSFVRSGLGHPQSLAAASILGLVSGPVGKSVSVFRAIKPKYKFKPREES